MLLELIYQKILDAKKNNQEEINSAIIMYVTNQFKIHEKYPTFQQQQKMNYRILFAGTGISKLIFLSFRLKHFVE